MKNTIKMTVSIILSILSYELAKNLLFKAMNYHKQSQQYQKINDYEIF